MEGLHSEEGCFLQALKSNKTKKIKRRNLRATFSPTFPLVVSLVQSRRNIGYFF